MEEKFVKILENIEKKKGEVTIFALLKMDEFIDKWTIVLCADWATIENRSDAFELIRNEIVTSLTKAEIDEIARIAIYPNTEHFIEELMQYKSNKTIENKRINGNVVHFAHIIKSKSTT